MAQPLTLTQTSLQEQTAPVRAAARIYSIDFLRGLVMIIMVLDHTRDFFHHEVLLFSPTDMDKTYPALFFTRFITHFCAPVFVFLAGTSIFLQAARGGSKRALAFFLITRGFWLIVLEFTLVRCAFAFDLDYGFMGVMQVIWAIGVSMIAMAGLIFLPLAWVGALGILMIFSHNLLDGIQLQGWQGPGSKIPDAAAQLWFVLHQPFQLLFLFGSEGPVILVLYPLIPWLGVMAAGYAFGALYQKEAAARVKILYYMGAAALLLFLGLRGINLYGDPQPWAPQHSWQMSLASFLNVTKYPVSLLYLLLTLGISFLLLARYDKLKLSKLTGPVIVFGRVPLFFYLLQWPLMHGLAIITSLMLGKPTDHLYGDPASAGVLPEMGFDLWVVYLFWVLGILILYPLCLWFATLKHQHKQQWWLSYL